MVKFRTLKNSYMKLQENFTHIITEEEALNRYMCQLIDEAEEDLKKRWQNNYSWRMERGVYQNIWKNIMAIK